MRVSRIFTVLLIIIGLFGVSRFSYDIYKSADDYRTVEELRILQEARTAWTDATIALSLERSVTQVALALDTPASPVFLDLIEQQRTLSDDLFQQALAVLREMDILISRTTFLDNAAQTKSTIAALRAEVDQMLSVEVTRRDAARTFDLPYEIKSAISTLNNLSNMLRIPNNLTSSQAIALSVIQEKAWEIREFGGRARTYYAIAALTEQPLPPLSAIEARVESNRAEQAWDTISNTSRPLTLPQSITSQMALAQNIYYDDYLPVIEQMNAAMKSAEPDGPVQYPINFADFFGLSSNALDQMSSLSKIAGAELVIYWTDRSAVARQSLILNSMAALIITLTLIGALAIVRLRVASRLDVVTQALVDVANGNLDQPVERRKGDLHEVVELIRSLDELKLKLSDADRANSDRKEEKHTLEQVVSELSAGLTALSNGDLTHSIEPTFGGRFDQLCNDFNSSCARLRTLIGSVVDSSDGIDRMSREVSDSTTDVADRIARQAASLEVTAAALSQISESVKSNAQVAVQADARVTATKDKAEQSGQVVQQAVSAMTEIKSSSDEITQIISLIDDISFQTNLLALNAGVEAARAGEAGRGFAVVASEVRSLSQRTTQASKEIGSLISKSSKHVETGVALVSDAGSSLSDIAKMVDEISQLVVDISSSSKDQNLNLTEVNNSVDHLDRATQQNAGVVGNVSTAGLELTNSAAELQSLTRQFKLDRTPSYRTDLETNHVSSPKHKQAS